MLGLAKQNCNHKEKTAVEDKSLPMESEAHSGYLLIVINSPKLPYLKGIKSTTLC